MANTAAARLNGVQSGDQLLGNTVLSLVHTQDRPHMREVMEEVLDAGYIRNAEYRLNRGDDTVIAEFQVFTVKDEVAQPTGFVHVVRDITSQKQREEQLKDQALHDPLTGLPNRVLFQDRLAQAIESGRRTRTEVGILYIDLDNFKDVNDTFGHDRADVLLEQLAHRMLGALRASDTLARLGGDEFAAVLPQADAAGAQVTAQKLKEALHAPFQIGEHRITVGAGIGIAIYPIHGEDPTTVLRRADIAMYAAKHSGRHHVLWQPEHDELMSYQHLPLHGSDVSAMQVDPRVLMVAREKRARSNGATPATPAE